MQIALTNFARRNWESESSSTRIEGLSQEELVAQCNQAVTAGAELVPGYAPFCTHLFLENTSPTRCAFAAITEQNRHLLQSGYRARREGELAVLERWFEGLDAPVAGTSMSSSTAMRNWLRKPPTSQKKSRCPRVRLGYRQHHRHLNADRTANAADHATAQRARHRRRRLGRRD